MTLVEQIKTLVSLNKTEEAIALFKQLDKESGGEKESDLIILESQFNTYKQEYLIGLDPNPAIINKIRYSLLEYLKELDPNVQSWLTVEVIKGTDKGSTFWIISPIVYIGRGAQGNNHVHLHDPTVSSHHGTIEYRENKVWFIHRSQSKETIVEGNERGEMLASGMNTHCELYNHDLIKMGDSLLKITIDPKYQPPQIPNTL